MSSAALAALLPIIGVSLTLGLRALRRLPALAAFCFGLVGWATSVLLTLLPATAALGERLLMLGFFVPAGLLHAVREGTGRGGERRLVVGFYGLATAFSLVGAVAPGVFLREAGTVPGPLFPLMLSTGGALSFWPVVELARALRGAAPGERERLRYLLLGGLLSTWGGGFNVLLLILGDASPAGLYMVLGGLTLVAWVLQSTRLPSFGRFVEGSLRYSVTAALLTTAYLTAVLVLVKRPDPVGADLWDAASTAVLLFLLVLVGQPFLSGLRGWLAGRLVPGKGDVEGLVRALAESEARSEHAVRLAELGALASAVAHEVRNPLGVIMAASRVQERLTGPSPAIDEIRDQVDRAARFADELLEYGRPAPLQLRPIDLQAAAELVSRECERALPLDPPPAVTVEGAPGPVQADLSQVMRLLAILIDNARLAAARPPAAEGAPGRVRLQLAEKAGGVELHVEDDGPGVPEPIVSRLFQPFATGRGRDGPRAGTGLGLAIARSTAERHGGSLRWEGRSPELGGALFVLWLPSEPPLPAGA